MDGMGLPSRLGLFGIGVYPHRASGGGSGVDDLPRKAATSTRT